VDPYVDIENRTGFRVPELYRRMRADGVCDYGVPEMWLHKWARCAVETPQTALLHALDFEWLSLEEIVSWTAPDYWAPEHLLIPFAQTHAGDEYAWYPAWAAGDDVPVVLAYHDENSCECLAPHLEGFLYRESLTALAFSDASERAESTGLTLDQDRRAMHASIGVLRPYLRPSWAADLEALAERAPRKWVYKLPRIEEVKVSQLDDRELQGRLERELDFSRRDAVFQHMKVGAW
jgi:hypothetical protein